MPLVHEEVLKSDCQKILHYVRSLPAKTEMLYAECQKLRRKGQMYCWPGLMEGLVTLLNKEVRKRKKREDSLERNILSDLITQIKDNDEDTPLQPLEYTSKSAKPRHQHSYQTRSKKMDVASLLS